VNARASLSGFDRVVEAGSNRPVGASRITLSSRAAVF
jgi:hypothetical protein